MTEHKINKLDDDLINKIAAGEVIERPASVVKELVENSLDAGSSKITVSIRDGGRKLIQVVDNGCGIPKDQLQLAVSRHATSKITKFDDLYHLGTNGFRGEALASICSVAKVSLASKIEDDDASEILVEGGVFVDQRAVAQPQGTRVTVKYLFYQTPARLKFLKSAATETSHVASILTKLALSHPDVGFEFLNNDRVVFSLKDNQSLEERIQVLLGKDLKDYLYAFSDECEQMEVWGMVGHPQVSRSQRTSTFFFVNGRPVQDKVLWHATMEAHRDLLMKGKYPVLILNLNIQEDLVDVNVHPTKSEIRFHQSQQVHQFVYRSLRDLLKTSPWLAKKREQLGGHDSGLQNQTFSQGNEQKNWDSSVVQNALKNWSEKFEQNTFNEPTYNQSRENFDAASPKSNSFFSSGTNQTSWSESKSSTLPQREIQFGRTAYANMTPIGQLLGTYILAEGNGKLVIIDQHAAHERIGFEKLLLQYEKEGIQAQPLLIPETFDLKASDGDILKHYLGEFEKFGFEIEFFGGNTFVLKAIPCLLDGRISIQSFMIDLVEDLKASGELISLKDKLHHVLATMACHAQIRAHHTLSMTEMISLLNQLEEYQFTDFCPHGRPVSVEVTLDEIEKWFKRVL